MANEYLISGKLVLDVADAANKLKGVETQAKNIESGTKRSTHEMGKDWEKLGKKISGIGSTMTKAFTLPILAMGAAMIKLGSDQQEASSKVDAVFGEAAESVKEWSDTTAEKLGMSKREALELAGTFGAMAGSLGLSKDEAATMAMNLATLAVDLASFHNISVERAGVALKGIFTGETEALKGLGIVMTEASLSQYAMENGATKSWQAMDQEEKTMWRLKFVMEQSATAQGDFARNADGVANKSKTAKAKLEDLTAQFGEKLQPVVTSVLDGLMGIIDWIAQLPPSVINAALWAGGIIAIIGPVTSTIGGITEGVGKLTQSFAEGGLKLATMGWVGLAVLAVAGIAAIAISIANEYNRIHADAIALNDAMATLNESMDTANRDYEADKANIIATSELADKYIDRLVELEAAGLDNATAQREYKILVDELKRSIPGLNIVIDENTGKIQGGADALRDQVKGWKETAIAQALYTKQQKELDAYAEAYIALAEAKHKSAENDAKIVANQAELDRLNRLVAESMGLTVEEFGKLSTYDLGNRFRTASSETLELRGEFNQLNRETIELVNGQNSLNTAVADGEKAMADAEAQIVDTTAMVSDYEAAQKAATEGAEGATAAVEGNTEALDDNAEAAKEAGIAVKNYADDVVSANDTIELDNEVTAQSLMETAVKNLQTQKDTMANMADLSTRGVSDVWLAGLYDMGEKGWSQIAAMSTMTDAQLAEYVKIWEEAGADAKWEYKDGIWQIVEETKDAAAAAATAAKEGGEEVGNQWSGGTKTGVEAGIPGIKSAARRAAQAAIDAAKAQLSIASPSKETKEEIGIPFAQGIGVGIEDGLKEALRKIRTGTSGLVAGLSPQQNGTSNQLAAAAQQKYQAAGAGTITQNNTFTTKTLTPYEQRVQLKKLDNDLAEVFA